MMTTQSAMVEHKLQMDVVGEGRLLALVGGGLTGWLSWEPHAERLSSTRRVGRVQPMNVQLGLEGRGLPAEYSVDLESAALKSALDGEEWTEPLDLVGWSYGALISLDFALNNPERIRTLTLIEPPAFWVLDENDWEDPAVQALQTLEIGDDVSASDLAAFLHSVGLLPPGAVPSELPQWPVWMKHRQSLRMLRVPLSHAGDTALLEAFDKPVLLVTGTGTATFHRRVQEILQVRLPNARLIEMPGGHAPNVVSIDRFLDELERFHETGVGNSSTKTYHIRSADGTSIGYRATGSGTPILFVHGTAADHRSWMNFASHIEERASVYVMDRRGRGLSGDGPEYDLMREAEDVAAVVDAIGEKIVVFGHSFGGLVALEASLLTEGVEQLILYEPPIPTGESTVPTAVREQIQTLVDRGELEAAMELMLREVAQIPDHELEAYRRTPLWAARIPLATTIPREMKVEESKRFDPARLADLSVPVWLLVGSDSPDVYRDPVEALHQALANSKVIVLRGQQHLAHHTAPELLADTIHEIVR